MTRKKVEAVINDCEKCPNFQFVSNHGECRAADKHLPDEWYDNHAGGWESSEECGYIPPWCPLEDAPCEVCGGRKFVCRHCGGILSQSRLSLGGPGFACCHECQRAYIGTASLKPCPACTPIDVSAIMPDKEDDDKESLSPFVESLKTAKTDINDALKRVGWDEEKGLQKARELETEMKEHREVDDESA